MRIQKILDDHVVAARIETLDGAYEWLTEAVIDGLRALENHHDITLTRSHTGDFHILADDREIETISGGYDADGAFYMYFWFDADSDFFDMDPLDVMRIYNFHQAALDELAVRFPRPR